MAVRNVKQVLLGENTSGREKLNGEGEGWLIWSIYFIYVCGDRTLNLSKSF
jgi:hypothetical protein